MSVRLHIANTDQFNDVGEGKRQNGELWYRADLNEIHAFLSGQVRTLFNNQGQPANLPPGGAVFTVNYDPTETVYMSIENPTSFVP